MHASRTSERVLNNITLVVEAFGYGQFYGYRPITAYKP